MGSLLSDVLEHLEQEEDCCLLHLSRLNTEVVVPSLSWTAVLFLFFPEMVVSLPNLDAYGETYDLVSLLVVLSAGAFLLRLLVSYWAVV